MAYIVFQGSDGNVYDVSAEHPLPVTGAAGGGGMTPEDIQVTAPATWDAETSTIGVHLGTGATDAAAGNHAHSQYATTTALTTGLAGKQDSGDYATSADLAARVAEHVDPATGTLEQVVNALVAAGLMASA